MMMVTMMTWWWSWWWWWYHDGHGDDDDMMVMMVMVMMVTMTIWWWWWRWWSWWWSWWWWWCWWWWWLWWWWWWWWQCNRSHTKEMEIPWTSAFVKNVYSLNSYFKKIKVEEAAPFLYHWTNWISEQTASPKSTNPPSSTSQKNRDSLLLGQIYSSCLWIRVQKI